MTQQPFLIDVRTPEEYAEGSVPGAVNIPLHLLPLRLDDVVGKESIVVFCESGGRAEQAKKFLEQSGIPNVTNGGGWREVAATI